MSTQKQTRQGERRPAKRPDRSELLGVIKWNREVYQFIRCLCYQELFKDFLGRHEEKLTVGSV